MMREDSSLCKRYAEELCSLMSHRDRRETSTSLRNKRADVFSSLKGCRLNVDAFSQLGGYCQDATMESGDAFLRRMACLFIFQSRKI